MKAIFKSISSVIAGFAAVAILSVATDAILEALQIFPPQSDPGAYAAWMLVAALLYRSFYTVVGGYVTARLAPQNPMRHVVVLAALGGVAGVLGAIAGWNMGNHWYPVMLAITGPVFVWIGGKLKEIWRTKEQLQ